MTLTDQAQVYVDFLQECCPEGYQANCIYWQQDSGFFAFILQSSGRNAYASVLHLDIKDGGLYLDIDSHLHKELELADPNSKEKLVQLLAERLKTR